MEKPEIVEHFFGVYLLYSTNAKYRGSTYIGFTVNPKRRIEQHNGGTDHGGAWKTHNKGPWTMVLIVHGFLNQVSALRFEWAWQHPSASRRLKHVPKKSVRQKKIEFDLMVLGEMLKVGPWCRLPLILRWLDDNFTNQYSASISPPLHMSICYGKVICKRIDKKKFSDDENLVMQTQKNSLIMRCCFCGLIGKEDETVTCIKPNCSLIAHLICISKIFSNDNNILPIEGICPFCNSSLLWGDLIRKMVGCYQNLHVNNDELFDEDSIIVDQNLQS